MFELIEKMYNEFSSFKTEMITEVKGIRQDLNGVKENVKILNEKIDAIELAVKDTSKDVKEIQENFEPLCEDMIVVKAVVKIISGDIEELSDKIEFIEMKEFNNERELFTIKKKLTQ